MTVPEQDELYDRRPIRPAEQSGWGASRKAKELLQQLKLYIGELRTL